jgi:hypothetical protein
LFTEKQECWFLLLQYHTLPQLPLLHLVYHWIKRLTGGGCEAFCFGGFLLCGFCFVLLLWGFLLEAFTFGFWAFGFLMWEALEGKRIVEGKMK